MAISTWRFAINGRAIDVPSKYPLSYTAPARNIVVDLIKASDQSVLFTVNTDANGNKYADGNRDVHTHGDEQCHRNAQQPCAADPAHRSCR